MLPQGGRGAVVVHTLWHSLFPGGRPAAIVLDTLLDLAKGAPRIRVVLWGWKPKLRYAEGIGGGVGGIPQPNTQLGSVISVHTFSLVIHFTADFKIQLFSVPRGRSLRRSSPKDPAPPP